MFEHDKVLQGAVQTVILDKAFRTLIEHELMHIGYETTKKGVRKFIEPHDVQEFRAIIDQHGLDWVDEL